MVLTQASALRLIEILVAFSCLLQTFEFLKIRKSFSESGIWKWSTLREEFSFSPWLEKALGFFLEDRNFRLHLLVRLVACVWLIASSNIAAVFILLMTSVLISLRWRGTFNGGSDYMTVLTLLVLTLAGSFQSTPMVAAGALWYLALQTVLSYFVSGWIKIKNRNWRSGGALAQILTSSNYNVPETFRKWAEKSKFSKTGSWFVMIFEISFPLAFLSPLLCLLYMTAALIFHLVNSHVLGLNRFLFAWLASYPALFHCALLLS